MSTHNTGVMQTSKGACVRFISAREHHKCAHLSISSPFTNLSSASNSAPRKVLSTLSTRSSSAELGVCHWMFMWYMSPGRAQSCTPAESEDRSMDSSSQQHLCTHAHAHTYTYKHTYVHTYMHTSIHTYMHTSIHTYMHTSIHTHTHTYVCIHTLQVHT